MDSIIRGRKGKGKPTDESALLMLLAYVEAECRRIGAIEAASHAAMAASAVEHGKSRLQSAPVLSGVCH